MERRKLCSWEAVVLPSGLGLARPISILLTSEGIAPHAPLFNGKRIQ